MKRKAKKKVIRGASLVLAAAAVAGLFLQTTMSVQAATAMPGIETIIKDNSEEQPFRILELVDNSEDAEIGYYISGQEPYIRLYTYEYTDENGQTQSVHFKNLEEGLSKLPEKERKEFAMNVWLKEDGSIDESKSTGIQHVDMKTASEENAPLSYTEYKEKYFLESSDKAEDWNQIDLTDIQGKSRTDTVKVNGTYKENKTGTGDYTKEEQQYYAIRQDVAEDSQQPEKYRENIQNFSYIEAEDDRAPYHLTFTPVSNSEVNQAFSEDKQTAAAAQQSIQKEYDYENGRYGYYENVYADLNSEIADNIINEKYTFPGENPTVDTKDALLVRDNQSQNTGETENVTAIGGIEDSSTAGTQENPYIYLGKNIDTYPYYQYTLVGDLKYVMQAAQTSANEETQSSGNQTSDTGIEAAVENMTETDSSVENASDADSAGTAASADVENAGDTDTYAAVSENALTDGQTRITLEDDQYWYWEFNATENSWTKTVLSIVVGRQAVSYQNVQKIPENLGYNYYYKVSQVWFCCQSGEEKDNPSSYTYGGWYYPSYPSGEDIYLPVEENSGEVATHYISAAEYTLTPGIGDYDFVPGGNTEASVQVNKVYYQGGYTNHDWLKRYVFYLNPEEADSAASSTETSGSEISGTVTSSAFDNFHIEVETRSASDWTKAVYSSGASQEDAQTVLEDVGNIDLSDYDLIYINGNLSADMAKKIVESQIACVVNVNRGINDVFTETFAAYMQNDDADGSYVSYQFYFYKNLFASSSGSETSQTTSADSLINSDFKTKFNDTQVDGFEAITKYIEQENQYRALRQNDENGSSENGGTDSLEPLDTALSEARALEYVINYQYKRNVVSKDKINVLEIMPDNNCHDYDSLEDEVYKWMGINEVNVSYEVCCEQTYDGNGNYFGVDNLSDWNTSTYWHSKWNNNAVDSNHPDGRHYITVKFDQPAEVSGFEYTPRPEAGTGGNQNGVLQSWTVQLTKKDGSVETKSGQTECTEWNRSMQRLIFDKQVSDVKEMKLIFESALVEAKNDVCASCAELHILHGTVQVTSMTASEFVGHIDDLTSEYDMIYIGSNEKGMSTDDTITGENGLRYAHVGAGRQVLSGSKTTELLKLLGQLDNEYVLNADGTKAVDSDGRYLFAPFNTYGPDGGGYFRGSGNDITEQKMEKLLEYVKSGYPVVLGNYLISNGKVNEKAVDNASYYYEFMTEALKYDNVMTAGELDNQTKSLDFFANLAKPVITFIKNGDDLGKPLDAVRSGETADASKGKGYIVGELKYVFKISNDSDASPASTTYDCNLYLDLNFDGNLSENESQDKYITIQDESGKVISQVTEKDGGLHYELQAGKTYTLIRKIPADYYKIITWKLEVSSNKNSYIHTSEMGYAKQHNSNPSAKQEIKVLQLLPSSPNLGWGNVGGTWNLSTDTKFQSMISQIEDFKITIIPVTIDTVNSYTEKGQMENLLSDVQMLVIGFNDTYQDISNEAHQVDAILDFIKKGKSVIFAHDTTSYVNYNYNQMHRKIADTTYNQNGIKGDENTDIYWDKWLQRTMNNVTWGLSLNTVLRSVVGMDRYGITSEEEIQAAVDGVQQETTVSALLKKGSGLNGSNKTKVSFADLMEAAGDVAYRTGDNRNSSYAQTQSYSNSLVTQHKMGNDWDTKVNRATKVNDGAITQYPYQMGDSISIATTHAQYYQLALEQDKDLNGNSDGESDVVVWYCLADNLYANSPNDVRNNYYFYSKGNVIYTGAGHDYVNSEEEIKLFINAMVAAANVTAVKPEVNFVDELNPDADIESARYYVTDQSSWKSDESNTLEQNMTFYINVKDYNMVSADLNQEDLDKQKMEISFFIDDSEGKTLEESGEEGNSADGAPTGSEKVTNITEQIGMLESYDGKTIKVSGGAFDITENNAFSLDVSNIEQYLRDTGSSDNLNGYKKNCKLYVRVKSTVYLYGQENSNISWASIDLKQRQLFELN